MTQALTADTWIKTLGFYRDNCDDETVRTLARMLIEIIHHVDDPVLARILNAYGTRLLENAP